MTDRVLEDLRRRAYEEAGPLPAVALRPADAIGHVLREDVHARHDLPPHEVVTVDGWAVAGPGPWQLVAATPVTATVPDGCAVTVISGATLPPGTSSVVPLSAAEIVDGRLHAETLIGDHVRARAAEVASGDLLIPDGTLMTPGAAALAAAGGNQDVLVTGRPTIALLVTYGAGTDATGTDAIEALLPSLLKSAGAIDVGTRRIPDTDVSLRATVDAVRADIVLVTGSSADERARRLDAVLTDARAEVVLEGDRDARSIDGTAAWLLVRLRDGRLLVALPGDVRGAVAATLTMVRPLVHGLCGYATAPAQERVLEVDAEGTGRSSFVFVRGQRPTPDRGPGTGHGVAAADALVLVPARGAAAGEPLPALPLT